MENLRDRLDRFKHEASSFIPALLVVCNLADAKRRNDHLGYKVVDQDIEELDQLLQKWASTSGLAQRVEGDTWLAISTLESIQSLTNLLNTYRKEQQIEVGWQCSGKKDGETKVEKRTLHTTITRAVRCLYSPVSTADNLSSLIDKELLRRCHGFVPDSPIDFSEAKNIKRIRWMSVADYPSELPFCPFCMGGEFEWEDGDGSTYSGSGTCKNCGADVDIRGIEVGEN